jgi:hypothetical protein
MELNMKMPEDCKRLIHDRIGADYQPLAPITANTSMRQTKEDSKSTYNVNIQQRSNL